jgi:YidC/Oxa1 family membrane protein insertase
MAMNRETMELYKREKVNPASGCLPILIQIPIFFSLYKVLYVTLDMRQAPFYGWIHDLSAPDPTSIFNLFGLLPFSTSAAFTIGLWPILMGLTMIVQQKLSPASSDPTQTKVLKFMPYVLTFVLAAFPAGLLIYWTWSNTLSILQQWLISTKLNKEKK